MVTHFVVWTVDSPQNKLLGPNLDLIMHMVDLGFEV